MRKARRIASARQERTRREDLAALLAAMRAEVGPATPEEEAWAKSVLGLPSAVRNGSSRSGGAPV